DPRVLVAVPPPRGGGADRVHHILAQYLGQRSPPHVQRRERKHVHPRVVVLVRGSRSQTLARQPGRRLARWPVRPFRLFPERALPVAGLAQQMIPRDTTIVRRGKQLERARRAEPVDRKST